MHSYSFKKAQTYHNCAGVRNSEAAITWEFVSRASTSGLKHTVVGNWQLWDVFKECYIFFLLTGLNYKRLTEENVNPLEALDPVLTSQNVLSISKLGPKIPEKDGRMLATSSVYAVWLKKLFWNGDPHLIKRAPETVPEWLHAYDICAKYFDRLNPGDIIEFMDEITFSSKAVVKVNIINFYVCIVYTQGCNLKCSKSLLLALCDFFFLTTKSPLT